MRGHGTGNHLMRRLISLAIALGLVLGSAPSPAAVVGDDRALVVTPSYRLKAFRWNGQQVRALTFTNGGDVVMKVATAFPSFSGRDVVSEIGARGGGRAAVNGGFRVQRKDAPRHLTVIDGELWTTGRPMQRGWAYASTASGDRAWIGRLIPEIVATQGETTFTVEGWNAQQPTARHAVAFTNRGGTSRVLSTRTCSALLSPVGAMRGPLRTYLVERVRRRPGTCDLAPLELPANGYDDVVLAGGPVRSLVEGQEVGVHVDLGHHGQVWQAFAGLPLLVDDGQDVSPECGEACDPKHGPDRCFACRNPRTVVGIGRGCSDKDPSTPCRGYMVTVDGRQEGWSEGIRFGPMAKLMIELGAYHAVNLDGGGSTEMWVRAPNDVCEMTTRIGCVVNRVAYATERPRNEAIVLVPTA